MVNRIQFFVQCWFSDEKKWFDYRTTFERFPLTLLAVCSGTFWRMKLDELEEIR